MVLTAVRGTSASPHAKVAAAVATCNRDWNAPPNVIHEQPKRRQFSIDGYLERNLGLMLTGDAGPELHCLRVAWPAASRSADGGTSAVAGRVNEAWFRAIANTLTRVPRRTHGSCNGSSSTTGRENTASRHTTGRGRTTHATGAPIWLHEQVFLAKNHWARGNYGSYWSYHVNEDERTIDGAGPEHALFSPVLLHELGHLVMYRLVNARFTGPAATSAPACAEASVKTASQAPRTPAMLEAGCVSPYCRSFQFDARTENWAEQYRFFYQGSATRDALVRSGANCAPLIKQLEPASDAPPWQRGLPDSGAFRKSRWQSCNGRACKTW